MDLISAVCNTLVLTEWLDWMKESLYTYRSMQNYVLALKTFASFLKDNAKNKQIFLEVKLSLKNAIALIDWCTAQAKLLAGLANKQTKARNSKESLQKNGKWAEFGEVLKAEQTICSELDEFIKETQECK